MIYIYIYIKRTTSVNIVISFPGRLLQNFEEFLEKFEITNLRDTLLANDINSTMLFLMVTENDLKHHFQLKLGKVFQCINAQDEFYNMD